MTRRKRPFTTAILGAVAAALASASGAEPAVPPRAEADAILGLWLTEKGQGHVEMAREGDEFSGRIVWLAEPDFPPDQGDGLAGRPKVDRNNPDPELRDRPIVGLRIAHGFRYAGRNEWKGGRIYDPENGKTYKCKMKLEGDTLKVRGFIGFSLLGRTTEWTRVDPEEAAARRDRAPGSRG